MTILELEPVARGRHQLHLRYRVGDLRFTTTYWYDTVDFDELEQRYGSAFLRSVEFHLLAFEANKGLSLKPTSIDFGPYGDLVTDEFWCLWETLFHHVWAVWRYENDLPDFRLQRPQPAAAAEPVAPCDVVPGPVDTLMLCGGGKDSLVSMKLLERGDVDYDAFVYSHSTYGRGTHQHDLIDGLLDRCRPRRLHRGWVLDDAIDSPAAALHPERSITRVIAAETVSSCWAALPLALAHGYTTVALGISRSTDEHNVTWDRTREEINYLWGMSSSAEELLHDYIVEQLVSNLGVFHILRPVYDVNVFTLLNRDLAAVPATHSCAQIKPWCCRCAKCIYVWMNYVAWLPASVVAETFTTNLFDVPENRTMLRKMLGLESYKPTDCIGTVSEARLAFLLCRRKGVGGLIADDIDLGPLEAEAVATLDHYRTPNPPGRTFPRALARVVQPQLAASADEARELALTVLQPNAHPPTRLEAKP